MNQNENKSSPGILAKITKHPKRNSLQASKFKKDKNLIKLVSTMEIDYTIYSNNDIILIKPDGTSKLIFSESLDMNTILVTNKCNNLCIMCPQHETDSPNIMENNIELISLIDPSIERLAFTGGEPTYNISNLCKLIKEASKHLPNTSFDLLTNAVNLSSESNALSIMSITKNQISFHVPLYASTALIHNEIVGNDTFHLTLKGIYNIWKHKKPIEIRIVITKLNYKIMGSLCEFIYMNLPFVKHVSIMGLEIMHNAHINFDSIYVNSHEYVDYLREAIHILEQRNINCSIYNIPLCFLPEPLHTYCRKSISLWKRHYFNDCNECDLREICGGVFQSNKTLDNNIRPYKKDIRGEYEN